jgi:regulator of RNase E activity RraA
MSTTAVRPASAPGDENLTTSIVSDSLDAVGLRAQVLPRRLAPISSPARAFGRAATLQFAPTTASSADGPYDDAIDFIDSLAAGELVVIATGASNASSFWGELFSAAAIGHGAVGVLTDGNLRDTDRIAALGFPAFSVSRRPIDYRSRMRVIAKRESVVVEGLRIDPGDLVLADADGVVVIPRAREEEVLGLARQRAAAERNVLSELQGGASLRSVWDRYRVL